MTLNNVVVLFYKPAPEETSTLPPQPPRPSISTLARAAAQDEERAEAEHTRATPISIFGWALARRRVFVLSSLQDCGRSAGPSDMKITLRPYANDKSRWHVDIRIMNPCNPDTEIRKRKVAPAGMSNAQARAWGERQVPKILGEALRPEATVIPQRRDHRSSELTLAEFFHERFEPEQVRLLKPATRVGYDSVYRNHVGPLLGEFPLAAIDEDRLSVFRAALAAKLKATTVNMILRKVAKMLRFARRLRLLSAVPIIDKMKAPREPPKPVYPQEQIDLLLDCPRSLGPDTELLLLLAFDTGLRASELCALRAGVGRYRPRERDGDRSAQLIWVQLFLCGGRERCSMWPKSSNLGCLPGLARPHLFRHTSLSRLAELGASIHVIQVAARHSRLETTQRYLVGIYACIRRHNLIDAAISLMKGS